MIHDTKEFSLGLGMLVGFFIALAAFFAPLFEGGKNGLDYLDGTFNSISKDSAYYIPAVIQSSKKHNGTQVTVTLSAKDDGQAGRMEKLFASGGATVVRDGAKLVVSGDMGQLLAAALADADLMFRNDGQAVTAKYGIEPRRVLYDWHQALGSITRDLNRQEKFPEAKAARDVQTKAVETAYNYYGIQAVPMSELLVVALLAMAGYVLYTIWYGFAILFLFEGWGLKLEH